MRKNSFLEPCLFLVARFYYRGTRNEQTRNVSYFLILLLRCANPSMPSSRILLPITAAALCVLAVLAFLWWELMQTNSLLARKLTADTSLDAPIGTAMRLDPIVGGDELLLHLRRGDIFALRGRWQDAEKEYEEAVSKNGGLSALRKLAQAQLQRRNVRGARMTLEQMKRASARQEDVLLLESIIDIRTGDQQKATELLTASPESPQRSYGLSLLAIIQQRHDEARKHLQEVIAGWEPALRANARTLMAAYDEYALFPDSPEPHLTTLLARSLAQVQECELALPLLAQVTSLLNDYRDAWLVQGYCQLTSERYQDALASLEHAYTLDPVKPEIQYFLARAHAALGDHSNAITFVQYALENGFEPKEEARHFLAEEALEKGDRTLALEQFDLLTQQSDATINAYSDFVRVSITLGHKEEAYAKAAEASQKWPNDASAWDLLGWAALESGRKEEAKTDLEKALQIDPNLTSAKERMGQLR